VLAASGSKGVILSSGLPARDATVPPLRAGNTWRGVKVAAVATCGRAAKDTLPPCGPAPAPHRRYPFPAVLPRCEPVWRSRCSSTAVRPS